MKTCRAWPASSIALSSGAADTFFPSSRTRSYHQLRLRVVDADRELVGRETAKAAECTAPVRAHASIATTASGIIGMWAPVALHTPSAAIAPRTSRLVQGSR